MSHVITIVFCATQPLISSGQSWQRAADPLAADSSPMLGLAERGAYRRRAGARLRYEG